MINFSNNLTIKAKIYVFYTQCWALLKLFKKNMSIKLNYSKKPISKISSNLVLFCGEKFKTIGLKNIFQKMNFLISMI